MAQQTRPPAALVDEMMQILCAEPTITSRRLEAGIRNILKGTTHRFPRIPDLVASYRRQLAKSKKRHLILERLLRCKSVRTDSGVAPITLLTKPYACPGKCVYCPTEVRMPKSYVASEPAAARALSLKFDPYLQVKKRIEALEANGHEAKKIDLIIKGGTWSAYPWAYRQWFVKRCFDAANQLGQKTRTRYTNLAISQKANEKADYRVIGLTIETRPDWITPKEIVRLRELGCTRVELGVQALDDEILALTNRGHDVAATVRATVLLKAAGFKTDYHFLPGQPGSSAEKDVQMFHQLFDDARFRPDMVKIYPCVVLPSAELAEWHKDGRFQPLEGEALVEAMIQMKTRIPYYCRISRLIRDFPSTEISGGNMVTNLRDVIKERMKERGLSCKCLRCREAGHRPLGDPKIQPQFFVETYENAGGTEYFLSIENPERTTLFAFLRLRLPDLKPSDTDPKTRRMLEEVKVAFPELRGAAIVRELHTYGQALRVQDTHTGVVQHKGHGRRLMQEAEKITTEQGYKKIVVISGIGVRAYYRELGYRLQGTYMGKSLKA
jgi:elongator complex protein 3